MKKNNDHCLKLIQSICDYFVVTQNSFGGEDPKRSLYFRKYFMATPFKALTLFNAGMKSNRSDYVRAADLFTLNMLAKSFIHPSSPNYNKCWLPGEILDVLCRGFIPAHPEIKEDVLANFMPKAAEMYDALQRFRVNSGHYFNIGYSPSGLSLNQKVDGAFSDDLGLVGRGLASYYSLCKKTEVLNDLIGLAKYYLTAHKPNCAEGCFLEDRGSWAVCPWPLEIEAEHIVGKQRADRLCWGFSNREAIDFLTRLYAWVEDNKIKKLIQDRVTRGMKWAFDTCQFNDGGLGIMGRDDAFTGMTAAGILNFLDCHNAGVLKEEEIKEYRPKAAKAMEWLLSWPADDIVKEAGHKTVNGGVRLDPPGNLTWMLAWTVDALLTRTDCNDTE